MREGEQRSRQLASALQDETRVLELLNETGRALASTLDLQSLLQAVTDAATALSGARFGAFFYTTTNDSGDALLLYTLSGAPREAFDKFGQPRATALFGPTFRGDAPIRFGRHSRGPALRPDVTASRHAGRAPAGPQLPRGAGPVAHRGGHRRAVLRPSRAAASSPSAPSG